MFGDFVKMTLARVESFDEKRDSIRVFISSFQNVSRVASPKIVTRVIDSRYQWFT